MLNERLQFDCLTVWQFDAERGALLRCRRPVIYGGYRTLPYTENGACYLEQNT